MPKSALLLVDLQNDFCPGGHLAVPGGDQVIPLANQLQGFFNLVIATKDWHPQDHMSFAVNHEGYGIGDVIVVDDIPQVLWPEHCIQHSKGSEFHPELNLHKIHKIFYKGIDKKVDSYSAFFDNEHLRSTGLGDYLRQENVDEIYIMGLATDYCVKYSTLDAIHLGFKVFVIEDGCRGVELNPGDISNAIHEMEKAGVGFISSQEIIDKTNLSQGSRN